MRRLRRGPPFCRTGGRRSRRRPASVRERGTSMCRSTPSTAEQRPSARAGQRFALSAAWPHTRLSGVILLSPKTEDRRPKTEDRQRIDRGSTPSHLPGAFTIEATTFTFAKGRRALGSPSTGAVSQVAHGRATALSKDRMSSRRVGHRSCRGRAQGTAAPTGADASSGGTATPQGASASTGHGGPERCPRLLLFSASAAAPFR